MLKVRLGASGKRNLLLGLGFELNDNDANESHVRVWRILYTVKYLKIKDISSSESSKKELDQNLEFQEVF